MYTKNPLKSAVASESGQEDIDQSRHL